MSEHAYRASFDLKHVKQRSGRAAVRALVAHAARAADEKTGVFRSHSNEDIDPTRTYLNMSFVNDQQGGYREAMGVDDLMHYYDARMAQVTGPTVKKKVKGVEVTRPEKLIRDDQYIASCIVAQISPEWFEDHLPNWREGDGRDVHLRLANLFADHAAWVVGGDQANVIGFDVNLDETSPHVHIWLIPAEHDPKRPGRLKLAGSKFFGKETSSVGKDTPVKGGKQKYRDMHAELRRRVRAAGFNVELESSERSTDKTSLPAIKAMSAELAHKTAEAEALREVGQDVIADAATVISEAEAEQWLAEQDLEADRIELAAEYSEAVDKLNGVAAQWTAVGAGLKQRQADIEQQEAAARADREAAAEALAQARRVRSTACTTGYHDGRAAAKAELDEERESLADELSKLEAAVEGLEAAKRDYWSASNDLPTLKQVFDAVGVRTEQQVAHITAAHQRVTDPAPGHRADTKASSALAAARALLEQYRDEEPEQSDDQYS